MAIYRIVGDQLLSDKEYLKRTLRHIPAPPPAVLGQFSLTLDHVIDSIAPLPVAPPAITPAAPTTGFTPIGIGKPLTIQIRHVYPGKFPEPGLFKKKDIAIFSSLKDYSEFAPATRALNYLKRRSVSREDIKTFDATTNGSPVIAYYPSVMSSSLSLTIEIAVDDFPDTVVSVLSSSISSASKIPLLLPYAGYLFAAESVVRIAGSIGNTLFDSSAEFTISESINFDLPGGLNAQADFRLLCHSESLAANYKYVDGTGLISRTNGKRYDGDLPYIVISLNGAVQDDLTGFAATAASAGVLKKFFDISEEGQSSTKDLLDGLALLSDWRYREKAMKLNATLANLPADSPDKARLTQKRDALVANISHQELKPDPKQ